MNNFCVVAARRYLLQNVYPLASFKRRLVTESSAALKRTALYEAHLKRGAKMTEFCGYEMPLQYNDGIRENHLFVRNSAGLFDVSHMGQVRIYGRHRASFLEHLVVADITSLAPYHAVLSLLTNEQGGIMDDTIITNMGDHLNMVINACCRDKDMAHLQYHAEQARNKGEEVIVELQEQRGLLALQGPNAMKVLSKHVNEDLSGLYFMNAQTMMVDGVECLVSRCGYTGEDGFEISVPNDAIVQIFDNLCDSTKEEDGSSMVRPSGLGARDSLRLEAGLCLYGNDMDDRTTPVEAALSWTIPKSRRESGGFLGDEVILKQLKQGAVRRRVGFILQGAPARGHENILSAEDGRIIGQVTSGVYSPCLGKPIGMGYVEKNFAKAGTRIQVEVRQKKVAGEVVKMPFVPNHFYKPEQVPK
jgi:aminomethyltransferase